MILEPANIVCPKCGNGNYMRHLIGKGVGKLNMKCINCNSYFRFDDLYRQKIATVIKPKTNADKIRAMTDEELANLLEMQAIRPWCTKPPEPCRYINDIDRYGKCDICALSWLKQVAK